MRRYFRIEYFAIVILVSVGLLPLFAQVGTPGGATAGIGINRRGFVICGKESNGVSCQNYTFGPCAACHELKTNAVFDDKMEGIHRNKHWIKYELGPTPEQKFQFGGATIRLVDKGYAVLNRGGKQIAAFPMGTTVIKSPNGGLWIFFPPKPPYYLSPEVERLIRSGIPSPK